MTIATTDPRTGQSTATSLEPTSADTVAAIVRRAAGAAPALARLGRSFRASLLRDMAAAAEKRRADLVHVADAETGLGATRLNGELSRSIFQLQLFADAIEEGSYLEAAIDHATDTVLGPQPDLRRMLVPLGPVAVFGSSNFPFAFSVLGGDVASALAAGCPVVAKAHSSHPLTSSLSFDVLHDAATCAGAPEGAIGIVFAQAAGTALVKAPEISAVGFTGSLSAAEALQARIAERETPIPFFGELSSVNPLVITAEAAAARGPEIAAGLFASFTGSSGQLCTKPGIAFVPDGEAGDSVVGDLATLTTGAGAAVLLNRRIHTAFAEIESRLLDAGTDPLAKGRTTEDAGFVVPPTLLVTDVDAVTEAATEECFGPLLVLARYRTLDQVAAALGRVPRSLTVTVHAEEADTDTLRDLLLGLEPLAGRLVYNGFPTGVRVSWAQTHGGPWPATNNQHTSVGVSSIRRWLRPVTWQAMPQQLLPPELRDGAVGIPRREDGQMITCSAS